MDQQPSTPPPAQPGINMHQKKLYSIILGGIGLVGLILPWAKSEFGGMAGSSQNGFQGWGILSLFGVIAIVVSCLNGDRTKDYDQNMLYLAMAGFGALTLGSFIFFMQVQGSPVLKPGIGTWFCTISGTVGMLLVTNVIKLTPPAPPAK